MGYLLKRLVFVNRKEEDIPIGTTSQTELDEY